MTEGLTPSFEWTKARRDLAVAFFAQFYYKLAGYVVLFILVRYLTRDEMGEFFFAASLATTALMVTELGLGTHLIRMAGARPEEVHDRLAEVLSIRLPLIALYLVVLNAGVALARPPLLVTSVLTSLYVGLGGLYSTFNALFLGLRRISWNVVLGVITQALLVFSVAAASRSDLGLVGVLTVYVAVNTLLVAMGMWAARDWLRNVRLRRPGPAEWRLVRSTLPLFLVALLQFLHFRIDTVMLGLLRPYDEVATYEAGGRLLEASQFLIRPFRMILLPLCVGLAARGAWPELRRFFRRAAASLGGLGILIAVGVVLLASQVVPILFGDAYRSTIPVLRVLYLSVPGLYVTSVSLFLLTATHREAVGVRILGVGVALNVVTNLYSIPHWGASGAAWTTVASQSLIGVWMLLAMARTLREAEGAPVAFTPEVDAVDDVAELGR